MKFIATLILAVLMAGTASADTFRFAASRVNLGVSQVDIAFGVYLPPSCASRWSVSYPAGFSFKRGSPSGGNLYGNPGPGSYDIALTTDACSSPGSTYVEPAHTTWHRVVVY